MNPVRHGYYSAEHHELMRERPGHGGVHLTADGVRIVTSWFASRQNGERQYRWPDKVYVGEFDTGTFRRADAGGVRIRW